MPVFDLIERMMIKKWNFPPGLPLRLVARSSFVGESHTHFFFLTKIWF